MTKSSSKTNERVLEEGFAKALNILKNEMRTRFALSGFAFLRHAWTAREFESFTGNTITSYAFGLYEDGVLFDSYISVEGMTRPLRKKIGLGEHQFLENPYEGSKRAVKGAVYVDDEYGYEQSRRFLENYKPSMLGYVLVVTTGTEYSEYLEEIKELNVLTNTWLAGKHGLVKPIMEKPIKWE